MLKNQRKKILHNIIEVVFPILLILLGLALSLDHIINYGSFTVLTQKLNSAILVKQQPSFLLANHKVEGNFKALEDNLGIVSVRFNAFNRLNDDIVVFRIKEASQNKWYYENSYTTEQFTYLPLFPFGFKPISNSKGKQFKFEIISKNGTNANSIGISHIQPNVVTSYQFEKSKILNNSDTLNNFVVKKMINEVFQQDLLFVIFVYFLPLLLYFIFKKFFEKFYTNKRIIVLLIFVITLDIFLIQPVYDEVILVIGIIWIIFYNQFKLKSPFFYKIGISYLILSSILYEMQLIGYSEKSSIWAFILFSIAVGASLFELRKGKKVYNSI